MAISSADMPPLPPDALDIKIQPDDALYGSAAGVNPDISLRRPTSFFGRLFRFALRAIVILCLCGLAWAGGAYYSSGHMPLSLLKLTRAMQAQQNPEHDQMITTMRQMADEIQALKSTIDQDAARTAVTDNVNNQQSQRNQPDSAQAATGAALTDLAGRVDKLQSDLTTKLAQIDEQLANIEKQISASHPAVAARVPSHPKHEHLHDAFDPNQHPAAVGAPHPLGTTTVQ
jgi:hypothetical protein